jgi:hypothetical protein
MSVSAATIEMTAKFRPDPANPMQNAFENTTPQSGHCKEHPTYCNSGVFSIGVPIRFRSVAPIQPLHDVRQGPMFRVPSSWKELTVINDLTGDTETVKMRVTGIGGAYTIKKPLIDGTWNPHWGYPGAPCLSGGVSYGGPHYFAFFWRVPPDAGICAKQAHLLISEDFEFAYESVTFSYELVTPEPLKMSAGTYRGGLSYGVGPHKDFDMGDVMLPDDDSIYFDFALSVEHTLKVEIPPGGDKVQLVPAGGWQSWLQAGRKPVRLFRDQTFNISASTRFKMQLECEFLQLFNCMVRDPVSQRMAVVQVSVSLPNGLTDLTGKPVQRRPLRVNYSQESMKFQPGFYVDRAPGILHFEMSPYWTNEIIKAGEGGRYSGNITVIWDSEV